MPFTPKFVDLVRNLTSVQGTGPVTLGAAVAGFTSLAAAVAAGEQFYYCIQGIDRPAEREVGRGTMQANGTISREAVSGGLTSFTSGTKTIALVAAAEWFSRLNLLEPGSAIDVADRVELAARDTATGGVAFLGEIGRAGVFKWVATNLAARVAVDPRQGIYVAAASDPTGASGAWVRQFDGAINVRWLGVAGDDATDDQPAFVAALAVGALFGNVGFSNQNGTPRIHIPAGDYYLATTLDIASTTIVEGDSSGLAGAPATRLRWPPGQTGIRVQRADTSGATLATGGTGIAGDASIIRGLTLIGGFTATEGEYHGIQLRARAAIEDVQIASFEGDGIHIYASQSGTPKGNANGFSIMRCRVTSCRNGLYLEGPDVNAGAVHQLDTASNRQWGVWDDSFLGNTYVGCHSATNGNYSGALPTPPSMVSHLGNRYSLVAGQEAGASTNAPSGTTVDNIWWYYSYAGVDSAPAWVSGTAYRAGGPYYFADDSGKNVVIGCYAETKQPPVQATWPTMILGGSLQSGVKGNAGYLSSISSGVVIAPSVRTQYVSSTSTFTSGLGDANTATVFTGADTVAAPNGWRLKLNGNDLQWDYANSNTQRAFMIAGPNTTMQFGTGINMPHVLFSERLAVGVNSSVARLITVSSAAPTTGTHARGEVVFNNGSTVGGVESWRCTVTGAPGTWVASGIVGGVRAAAQGDSVAADVAALKVDFNALLAKLRTANLVTP